MLTRKEFYELSIKNAKRTEEEQQKLLEFRNYLMESKKHQAMISDLNLEILQDCQRNLEYLNLQPENMRNENMKDAIEFANQLKNIMSLDDVKKQKEQQEYEDILRLERRKNSQAGFLNGTILIFLTANLGLFLACLLLLIK